MERKIHKKISEVLIRLAHHPLMRKNTEYYAEAIQNINIYEGFPEKYKNGNIGIQFTKGGINLHYNKDFIDSLPLDQLTYILLHQVFTVLHDINSRKSFINASGKLSEIAQDMILNNILSEYFVSTIPNITEPTDGVIKIPEENIYQGTHAYEALYSWLRDNIQENNGEDSEGSEGSEGGEGGEGGEDEGSGVFINGKELPNSFSTKMDSEVSDEEKEMMIDYITCSLKNRGLDGGNAELILSKLRPAKINYLRLIQAEIQYITGAKKEKSILRPNRRQIDGLKGKRKYSQCINCLLDTSGSMYDVIKKAVTIIMQRGYSVNLIQCDTEVKSHTVVDNSKSFNKLGLYGFGGTTIQPGIDYIVEKKINKISTIIITDGYTDTLDLSKMGKVLIITTDNLVPLQAKYPNVRQIIVDPNNL